MGTHVGFADFYLEVALGLDPAVTLVTVRGDDPLAVSGYERLVPVRAKYAEPAADAIVQVSSSNANDDDGGSGAEKVTITGILNGAVVSQEVTLNGQTGVDTTQTFDWINSVEVTEAGSSGVNAGDIHVSLDGQALTAGVPNDNIHATIPAGEGAAPVGSYRIPIGYQAYIIRGDIANAGGETGSIRLFRRPVGGIKKVDMRHDLPSGFAGILWTNPVIVEENIDILLEGHSTDGTALACSFTMLLMNIATMKFST